MSIKNMRDEIVADIKMHEKCKSDKGLSMKCREGHRDMGYGKQEALEIIDANLPDIESQLESRDEEIKRLRTKGTPEQRQVGIRLKGAQGEIEGLKEEIRKLNDGIERLELELKKKTNAVRNLKARMSFL